MKLSANWHGKLALIWRMANQILIAGYGWRDTPPTLGFRCHNYHAYWDTPKLACVPVSSIPRTLPSMVEMQKQERLLFSRENWSNYTVRASPGVWCGH